MRASPAKDKEFHSHPSFFRGNDGLVGGRSDGGRPGVHRPEEAPRLRRLPSEREAGPHLHHLLQRHRRVSSYYLFANLAGGEQHAATDGFGEFRFSEYKIIFGSVYNFILLIPPKSEAGEEKELREELART